MGDVGCEIQNNLLKYKNAGCNRLQACEVRKSAQNTIIDSLAVSAFNLAAIGRVD